MRRKLFSGTGLSIVAFLTGLVLASTATAQTVTPPVREPANAAVIKTLISAHKLLAEANHDYDGHRAKAAQEVHEAVMALGHHRHPKAQPGTTPNNGAGVPPKGGNGGQQKTHEPQSVSDGQLQQAQQLLQAALTQLGNHPKAAASVKAAIAEINLALSIK